MESGINLNNFDDRNVDIVVAKYKRAAAFLWTVLHAQGCQLSGLKCHIQGCSDTKRLLVHILSCPAYPGHACPVLYDGCHQARKLIGHYRECRKRQHAQRNKEQKSQCLLCTLLGRHKPMRIARDKVYQLNLETKPDVRSNLDPSDGATLPVSSLTITRSLSEIMPPPPPRPRTDSLGSIHFPRCTRMSLCPLNLSGNDEHKYCENNNSSICRSRSGSLDDSKVRTKSSSINIDPTIELHLAHPSIRNEEGRSYGSSECDLPIRHGRRRRSMSCSNMSSSNRCDTILEETPPDDMDHL